MTCKVSSGMLSLCSLTHTYNVVLLYLQVDQIPNLVTAVAFGLSGDVITGDASGRIFVWIKDNSDAFVVDRIASENIRHAHEARICIGRFAG